MAIAMWALSGCSSQKTDGYTFQREYSNQKPVSKDITTAVVAVHQSGAAIIPQSGQVVLAKKRFVTSTDDPKLLNEYELSKSKAPVISEEPITADNTANDHDKPVDSSIYVSKKKAKSSSSMSVLKSKPRSSVSSSSSSSSSSSVFSSAAALSSSSSSVASSLSAHSTSSSSSSPRSVLPLGAGSHDPRGK